MKELTLSGSTFDHDSKFRVAGVSGDVSLKQDYKQRGDGILWGLCAGSALQATYTAEQIAHRDRMRQMEPIQSGEIVTINGQQYKARVLGNYSDCVIFDLLTA
jgi:hypothetical protein